MKILFLGTGSAFCLKNYHSNALIIQNNKKLLIDAGSDIRFALAEQNLSYKDIDSVYISHFHNDHTGGLEYLAFKSFFDTDKKKIQLLIHKNFVDILWENSLKASMGMIFDKQHTINDFFDVVALEKSFIWEDVKFELIETQHVTVSNFDTPVFGLLIIADKKLYITGDTRFLPELLNKIYNISDIIIHDTETSHDKSIIHASYDDLIKLSPDIKAKSYLWHYQDNVTEDYTFWQKSAIKNGFKGFLKKGDSIEI